MSHRCHALGCEREVPPRLLMCAAHWREVPPHLKALIRRYYRPGQERDKRPSPHYVFAQRCVVLLHALKRGLVTKDEVERRLAGVLDQVGDEAAREVMSASLRLKARAKARRARIARAVSLGEAQQEGADHG